MTSTASNEGRPFWASGDVICVGGKNEVAVDCLEHLLRIGVPCDQLCVTGNRDDTGKNTWQPSLLFAARKRGVRVVTLESLYDEKTLWFFSLEFDRLIRPERFASRRLYNMHFSMLPAYRGVSTSVWPILNGEKRSGVTFHEIDAGIDSGPVLIQEAFDIGPDWTARDLYFAYQAKGTALFRDFIRLLGSGLPTKTAQDDSRSSLYRRKDINYKDVRVDLVSRASQIHDKLRAFTFWEYQLPKIAGRPVWRTRLLDGPPSGVPGSVRSIDEWRALVSGLDGDVELFFSPYDQLFSWAAGETGAVPPPWSVVPSLDLQNAKGWSPLMVAAYNGNAEAVRMLLAAGASPDAANLRGTTPLMYAFTRMTQSGDAAAFSMILAAGADAAQRDANGFNIADYAPPEIKGDLKRQFPSIFRCTSHSST